MTHICPACGTPNDDWRPFCTDCSQRLDGANAGVPGPAGSAIAAAEARAAAQAAAAEEAAALPEGVVVVKPANGPVRAALAVAVLVAVTGVAFGGIAVAHHLDTNHTKTPAKAATKAAPKWPSHWDPRLLPLAQAAERLRGLKFKHPVAAGFYDDAQFNKLDEGSDDNDKDSRTELERITSVFRALGVAPADLDLAKTAKTLADSTDLAFYDFDTKRIAVRGTHLDVAHDVTIVHELTHALQDQYFNLTKVENDDTSTSIAESALVEGDAEWVEDQYVDGLSKTQKAEYDREQQQTDDSSLGAVASVPDVLVLTEQAPYDMGETFVKVLRDTGGEDAVNAAFKHPPTSDWYFVDPLAYIDHQHVTKVARPSLPAGAKFLEDEHETGSFELYLVLAERIDAHTALAASDAWRGDDMVLYSLHGESCLRDDFTAAGASGQATMQRALREWSEAMPKGDTSVARWGADGVALQACDAGARTPKLTHKSSQAYVLPTTRVQLLDTFIQEGAGPATSWCAAGHVVYGYSVAQLNDDNGAAFDTPAFENKLRTWIAGCQQTSLGT